MLVTLNLAHSFRIFVAQSLKYQPSLHPISPCSSALFKRGNQKARLYCQSQPRTRCSNSADLTDLADSALILRVVLRAIKRTRKASLASVNRCVGGTTDIELAKRVEFDVDRIVWRPFANGFDLPCLGCCQYSNLTAKCILSLTVSLNFAFVPRSISAFAKPSALPNCLFLFARFIAENRAKV